MNEIHIEILQPIPIIKLIHQLTNPKIPQILLQIRCLFHPTAFAVPHTDFQLIVRIECTTIKQVDRASLVISTDVAFPAIAVNERGLDGPPFGFKGSKKLGNYVREKTLLQFNRALSIAR